MNKSFRLPVDVSNIIDPEHTLCFVTSDMGLHVHCFPQICLSEIFRVNTTLLVLVVLYDSDANTTKYTYLSFGNVTFKSRLSGS